MPPRMALFERKGGATPLSSNDQAEASAGSPGAEPDVSSTQPRGDNLDAPEDGGAMPCECPNCGCVFDNETGEVLGGYEAAPMDAAMADAPTDAPMMES